MHPAIIVALAHMTAFNVKDVEQFVAGMVFGLVQEDDLTKIEACMKDAGNLEVDVEEALSDFMKGDIKDIIAGVQVVMRIVEELPADLGECKDMQSDLDKIEAWIAAFTNIQHLIETLTTNLVKNFIDIETDIVKCSEDISVGDMYTAGMDIADLMVKVLGPVPASQPEYLTITQW